MFDVETLSPVLAYTESTSPLQAKATNGRLGEDLQNLYFCCYFAVLIASGLKMTHFSFKITFVCCARVNMNKIHVPIGKK